MTHNTFNHHHNNHDHHHIIKIFKFTSKENVIVIFHSVQHLDC